MVKAFATDRFFRGLPEGGAEEKSQNQRNGKQMLNILSSVIVFRPMIRAFDRFMVCLIHDARAPRGAAFLYPAFAKSPGVFRNGPYAARVSNLRRGLTTRFELNSRYLIP